MKILILGASGGLAQILIKIISNNHPEYRVLGIDNRSVNNLYKSDNIEYIKMKYSRGNFENLFRHHHFETVYHLARQTHTDSNRSIISQRMDFAVLGTARILELCESKQIKNLIFLSTFHVYGAYPDNPVFIDETAPLKASLKYPDLRDVVEMDQICTSWMWKNQNNIKTVLLRPCNILGTQVNNAMTKYLSNVVRIAPIDFNPQFQFIHEFDMANILYKSMTQIPTGVYNVTGNDFISLKEAYAHIPATELPFPIMLAALVNKALKKLSLNMPEYLIDYLKYSCLISNKKISKYLKSNDIRYTSKDALSAIRLK